ncbi:inositol phosphorylceramide synthase [Streptomyces antimycoticus]|uniref:Inositol phosphorylceramide synthase n=1 Tax=Streptomyces antimycoticus TaxID=68175 RepID=A0A499USE0_9ACTN|nr:phosphatase PAP2 family protein [Streptomyces antimycoticus]BBJ43570.1 inositol phosphorylceramide synthase [Streptomyces antimycoticus]
MPHTVPRAGAAQGSRPRWWTELPLIAVVYAAYSAGRLLARGDVSTAVDHGLAILHFEQRLNIDFESPLNDLFTAHAVIGIPADFAYASLHYVLTPAILLWMWKRRKASDYRFLRTWLLVSTIIGLIGFTLLPTCPPRLLEAGHGFVDTMAQYRSYGWWGGDASAPRGLGGLTNQYAAMPSLHVGWALWCGIALWRHGRSTWAKIGAVGYPLAITLVVMGTANHYFLDAVVGAAVMALGALLTGPALRLTESLRSRLHPARETVTASRNAGVPANVGDKCETSARERERIPRQQGRGADRQRTDGAADDGGRGAGAGTSGRGAGASAGGGRGATAGGSAPAADDEAAAAAR